MTTIRLTLDVASLRDKNRDSFCNPEVSLSLLGQEFVVELSNIPADDSDRILELREEVNKVRDELWRMPSQGDVDYWRGQYEAARKDLTALQVQHAPENLKAIVRSHIPSGNKINAIKAVREATCWGLKESKDFMDMVWGAPAPVSAEELAAQTRDWSAV